MDADDMADALTWHLNKDSWKAIFLGLGEIKFTNENGEEYRLTVEEWDAEWNDSVPGDAD